MTIRAPRRRQAVARIVIATAALSLALLVVHERSEMLETVVATCSALAAAAGASVCLRRRPAVIRRPAAARREMFGTPGRLATVVRTRIDAPYPLRL